MNSEYWAWNLAKGGLPQNDLEYPFHHPPTHRHLSMQYVGECHCSLTTPPGHRRRRAKSPQSRIPDPEWTSESSSCEPIRVQAAAE
ncbi:hypothetical protein SRHO_G00288630 [Serrasalmus rhombeus]